MLPSQENLMIGKYKVLYSIQRIEASHQGPKEMIEMVLLADLIFLGIPARKLLQILSL
jgi:hypothetical protein